MISSLSVVSGPARLSQVARIQGETGRTVGATFTGATARTLAPNTDRQRVVKPDLVEMK